MSQTIDDTANAEKPFLIDGFNRSIAYLRLSVTDRCDFRCQYCMAEDMTFLPRSEVLSLEELARVARVFVDLGVRKIRVTGGEPLVRKGVDSLLYEIGKLEQLDELAITTNASQLAQRATILREAGVRSLNISLDTLEANSFKRITRTGDLARVLTGIDAAVAAGFERIRLNAVILKGQNEDQILPLAEYAIARGIDIAYIEEMPLGQVNAAGKALELVTSDRVLDILRETHVLEEVMSQAHAGPARYFSVAGSRSKVGVISPHSNNFCSSCNRLRVTAEGQLLLCLGNEHAISLRDIMRDGASDQALTDAIRQALYYKPERHVFDQPDEPQILRFMNASGG
jgi:cyclic pyranopterin phosphate synthase